MQLVAHGLVNALLCKHANASRESGGVPAERRRGVHCAYAQALQLKANNFHSARRVRSAGGGLAHNPQCFGAPKEVVRPVPIGFGNGHERIASLSECCLDSTKEDQPPPVASFFELGAQAGSSRLVAVESKYNVAVLIGLQPGSVMSGLNKSPRLRQDHVPNGARVAVKQPQGVRGT